MVPRRFTEFLICLLLCTLISALSLAQDESNDSATIWPPELTINVKADGSGDYPTLEVAVRKASKGTTIKLGPGSYRPKKSLKIYRSLRLIGAGMDQTEVISDAEEYVVYFAGEGPFEAEGITFRHLGNQPADVVSVLGGEINFTSCRFIGGIGDEEGYDWGMGLRIEKDTSGVVKDCEIVENEFNGIYVTNKAELTLKENLCANNGWSGIAFYNSASGLALKNECIANKNAGIWVGGDAHPTLEENICSYNDGSGIDYYDNASGIVRQNECSWNGYHGIAVFDEANPTLVANLTVNNADSGIAYFDNASGVTRHNKCSNNAWHGIYLGGETNPVLESNVCIDNSVGIYVSGNARGSIRQNESTKNDVGIFIKETSNPDLSANRFYGNSKLDVDDQRVPISQEDRVEEEKPTHRVFIYEDDFTNPVSGWITDKTETVWKGYANGEYSIDIKETNHSEWALFPVAGIPRAFCLEIRARKVGDSNGLYGILFGFQDPKNYYLYVVDPFGNYKLERVVDGKAVARIDWKYSYRLKNSNHTNNLRIVVDTANNVNLYANGELIHTVLMEPYYEGGDVALYARSDAENFKVNFSSVKLRAFQLCQPELEANQ